MTDEITTAAPVEVSTSISTNAAPPVTTETPTFMDSIPETYRDKEYLKNVDSMESLLGQYDNAQKLIGKKQIPGEGATPEEMEEFYTKLRPETQDGYAFDYAEGVEINPEFEKSIKGIFHKAGLTSSQASSIQKEFDALTKSMAPDPAVQDAEFNTLSTEVFGERLDEATRTTQKLLAEFAPDKFKGEIAGLGNKELVIMASVIDGISQKYISEDKIPGGGGDTVTTDKRAKGKELMASEAYRNSLHPDHDKVAAEVKEIYRSLK